jgi:hypothetical protein
MAVGRDIKLPEQAESWGEFHALLEAETAALEDPWTPLWWSVGGLLFATGLIASGYALTDKHWWLWVIMLASLAAVGIMASRAVERADRRAARSAQLASLWEAWEAHVERGSPTW